MKLWAQTKAQLFNSEDPILLILFFDSFQIYVQYNRTHKGAVMSVFSYYISETLANAVNSQMWAPGKTSSIEEAVQSNDTRSSKLLRPYLEAANYLQKSLNSMQ